MYDCGLLPLDVDALLVVVVGEGEDGAIAEGSAGGAHHGRPRSAGSHVLHDARENFAKYCDTSDGFALVC